MRGGIVGFLMLRTVTWISNFGAGSTIDGGGEVQDTSAVINAAHAKPLRPDIVASCTMTKRLAFRLGDRLLHRYPARRHSSGYLVSSACFQAPFESIDASPSAFWAPPF